MAYLHWNEIQTWQNREGKKKHLLTIPKKQCSQEDELSLRNFGGDVKHYFLFLSTAITFMSMPTQLNREYIGYIIVNNVSHICKYISWIYNS